MNELRMALCLTPYKDRAFDTISIPLGLAWIYSYLEKHLPQVKIDIYDFLLEPELEDELFERINNGEFDILGIQAHSNATAHEAIRISKTVKKINKKIKVIIGGNAATFAPQFFLMSGAVDFVVFGEGEITLKELLEHILNKKNDYSEIKGISYICDGKVVRTSNRDLIVDLNTLPLPDRKVFHWKKYPQWSLMTSRGCPFSCSYCSSTQFWGKRIRFRNADNVFEEIQELVKEFHVKRLYILDDTFGVNREETTELLNRIIDNDFKLEWACLTRAEIVDEEYLDLFKKAGCVQVHFGLETANIETQSLINKNLNINYLTKMVRYAQSISLKTKLSVIFGLPNETEEQILHTIDYLLEMKPNEVQIYPLMPYIGIDILDNSSIRELERGKHHWKQDALVPLTESASLPTEKQKELTQLAITEFQKLGYKWIPMDMNPEKHDEERIIKTVFAPIQGIKRNQD